MRKDILEYRARSVRSIVPRPDETLTREDALSIARALVTRAIRNEWSRANSEHAIIAETRFKTIRIYEECLHHLEAMQ